VLFRSVKARPDGHARILYLGHLSKNKGIEELAKKILLLLLDPVRAENMGDEAARKVRQYYSQEIIIPQIINVYQRVVDKQRDCCRS